MQQRMLPAMQQAYVSWSGIRSNLGSIKEVLKLLRQTDPLKDFSKINKKISMEKELKFSNISFKYKSNTRYILSNVDLRISKGEFFGIIGKTGSGKSTLIDLMMGLLEPTFGEIFVDGKNIYSNQELLKSWRSSIGHVPQNIFLSDCSIYET